MTATGKINPVFWAILLIACAGAAAFWGVVRCDFLRYDDPDFVTDNPRVSQGLAPDNIVWAFKHTHGNWAPLDTLSHMADCTLFGLNPAGHHAMNLALHVLNAVLLFLALWRLTGALWPSALAAALFAAHPMNTEAVAWVSSRKDVLSTFFAVLSLNAYASYARRPGTGAYVLVLATFALALLAKPMAVTLPAIFLLLDAWPLGRLRQWEKAVLEKLPMFALSIVIVAVTYWAQSRDDSVMSGELYPLGMRLSNAAVSYWIYARKFVFPSHFAVYYPYVADAIPVLTAVAAAAGLLAVSALLVWAALRTRPVQPMAVGWLWFLGALVPVGGAALQLGPSAMADRYMYVPMIGLGILTAWGLAALVAHWPALRPAVAVASTCVILALIGLSNMQVGHWRDTEKLWRHDLAVVGENARAHGDLGAYYLRAKNLELAAKHLGAALNLNPDLYLARNNYGTLLAMSGDTQAAEAQFREAVRIKPDYVLACMNLARCLIEKDRDVEAWGEATRLLNKARAGMSPDDPNHKYLALLLRELGTRLRK